jgi:hypothetical protein
MSDQRQTKEARTLIESAINAGGVLVTAQEHTLIKRLQERRITPEVIAAFDIRPKRNGWEYPTPNGGLRWKNADPKNGPKYAWLDGKAEKASDLYYLDDLALSVDAAGGACYLASGEPDLWALRSAGITNALCGFSENTVNPDLADKLHSIGVLDLFIFPDLDPTGRAWAAKVATVLQGSGIELHCKRLPKELGNKGDLGLYWQRYTKPSALFERDLLALPRWLPVPEKPAERKQATYTNFAGDDIPADYRRPFEEALGVTKYNAAGWSNNVLCVFHDDNKPSANLGLAGLHCKTCGQTYNWNSLADRLGLDTLADYHKAQAAPDVAPVAIVATVPDVGLSLEAVRELVKLGFADFARVIYLLFSNGFEGGQIVTNNDIQPLCKLNGLSDRSGRNALKVTRGELPTNKQPKNEQASLVLHFFRVIFLQHNTAEENAKLKTRAKNLQAYRLPTRQEINAALGIVGGSYCLIDPSKLQSQKTFRATILAAYIAIYSGDYTRKQLGDVIGVSGRTTQDYCKIEDIEVTPNYKRTPLTVAMIEAMPNDPDQLRKRRKPRGKKGERTREKYAQIEATTAAGDTRLFMPCKMSIAKAYDFAGDGGQVVELIRLANTYKPKE